MKFIGLRSLALISVFLSWHSCAGASTRPRYGGTLRVELHAATVSLDPRQWELGSAEFATNVKLGELVFDRLVALDNYGRFQPQLATEWTHDAAFKRWQFTLRPGVKYSDGTPLATADVVAALHALLSGGRQISASGNSVVIQSAAAMPDLLEELASGRFFVYRVQPDGTLMGTGPFFVSASDAGAKNSVTRGDESRRGDTARAATGPASGFARLHFRANEETWSGRPFVDAIEVTLGVPALRRLFDLQLGKADLVELAPDLMRRARQENLRVWSSAAATLYGLHFDDAQPEIADAKLREAISVSLDRQTMANVLLQKQAEPAAALLPQWLSGYAFLFATEINLEHGKGIRAGSPTDAAGGAGRLRLRVDAPGDLAKLLGERVAVNARQAGILLQAANRAPQRGATNTTAAAGDPAAGVHLFAWHYSTLSPRVELEKMVSALNFKESSENAASSTDPEQLYTRERKLLEERRVLPLVLLPEYVGLGQNVRDWMPTRWGEWHLAEVWLEPPESHPEASGNAGSNGTLVPQPLAAPAGAKP